jgi:hypothetical protein
MWCFRGDNKSKRWGVIYGIGNRGNESARIFKEGGSNIELVYYV